VLYLGINGVTFKINGVIFRY